jgi:hypothetical protein
MSITIIQPLTCSFCLLQITDSLFSWWQITDCFFRFAYLSQAGGDQVLQSFVISSLLRYLSFKSPILLFLVVNHRLFLLILRLFIIGGW